MIASAFSFLRALVVLWLALGVLLHITGWRDQWLGLSIVFYSTPWLVVAAALAVLACFSKWRSERRGYRISLLLCLAALGVWAGTSWFHSPGSNEEKEMRVVLWNVARPTWHRERIISWLRDQDADIVAVAEAIPKSASDFSAWTKAFPGYRAEASSGDMLCLFRGEVLEKQTGSLRNTSFYARYRVRIRGVTMTVIQVDLYSRPDLPRRPPLEQLAQLVAQRQDEKVIVLGDFNTPRESAHLDLLRSNNLKHCFEASGRGLAETWPMPVPVLSLDQIWVGGGLRPIRCKQAWSIFSDHRAVIADLRFSN